MSPWRASPRREPIPSKDYQSYDWRPEGRDGESKDPPSRITCDAPEILSRRRSPSDRPAAGLPCRTPRKHYDGPRPASPGRSPKSFYAKNLTPRSEQNSHIPRCDNRLCDQSERFLSRASPAHLDHCHSQPSGDFNRWGDRPIRSWNGYSYRHGHRAGTVCLSHSVVPPGMEAAGVVTRNYEYPFPPETHSIVRLDSYVKHQGLYTRLGQIVKQSFLPRPGDVIITKLPRICEGAEIGYVEFFTGWHEGAHFCPGDLLIRTGKFVEPNTWRFAKRYKLYQRTDEHQWLFIGMVDNFVNLQPVHIHGSRNHVDRHCRFFFPRRGDLVIHVHFPDMASQLEWFSPKTTISKGNLVVRMYIGEPSVSNPGGGAKEAMAEVVEATVEIYHFAGKGCGWIYMGRDDVWYKDGLDLLKVNSPTRSMNQ